MRLRNLRLLRYGPFEDLSLEFDSRPRVLNVILAPNGAGKSVLREAIGDMLFGIPPRTPMHFRFGMPGMRITAEAIGADGAIHPIGRRKGMGNTFLGAGGEPADSSSLAGFLGQTDRVALERLFALDTQRLREGGQALLAAGGDVAAALLEAGGLSGARALRAAFLEQAEELAPDRKYAQRPFYKALQAFTDASRAARNSVMKPEAWHRKEQEEAAAIAELEAAHEWAKAARVQNDRLQRLRRVRVPLAVIEAARAWLAGHPEALDLPPALGEDIANSRKGLASDQKRLADEQARLEGLVAEHDRTASDPPVLAVGTDIDALADQSGAVAKALADTPGLAEKLAVESAAVARLLRDLGATVAHPQARRLIPERTIRLRTRELIGQHEGLQSALIAARNTASDLNRDIAASALADPGACDTDETVLQALRALLEEVQAEGNPVRAASESAERLEQAQVSLRSALAAVPGWTGNAAALRDQALPPMPVCERTHTALAAAEKDLSDAITARNASEARLAQMAKQLAAVTFAGELPDREAVAASRARRDALWAALRDSGEAMAGERAQAYLGAVVEADRLADRRADESQRIEAVENARRMVAEADGARAVAAACAELAETAARGALAAWTALLPAPLHTGARLDDLRLFTAARADVLKQLEAFDIASASDARLAQRHAAWAIRLREALGWPETQAGLPACLIEARKRVADGDRDREARTRRDAKLGELRRQLEAARRKEADAHAALAAWRVEWAGVMRALHRDDHEKPEIAAGVLQIFEDLDRALDEADRLRLRLRDIAADTADFVGAVAAICAKAEQNATIDSPAAALAAVPALRERRDAARQNERHRRTLADQAAAARDDIVRLTKACNAAREKVESLRQRVGAASDEDVDRILQLAAQRASHVNALREAEEQFLHHADGVPEAQLRAELAETGPDALAQALQTAEASASAAAGEIERAATRAADLRSELARIEMDLSHRDAKAAEAEAAAQIGRILHEALVARVASAMLAQAMDAVEREGSRPMLDRIGHWFRVLTDGTFDRVTSEANDQGGLVLAMRPSSHPHESRAVAELSEGTRDQLFLALRLAAIEAHPQALPFIADDILQTSDDKRTEDALRAMLELSGKTQVIVLTHHRHVAELAREVAGTREIVLG
jgi:uncharacterized protein YhaN